MSLITLKEKAKEFQLAPEAIKEREQKRLAFIQKFPIRTLSQLTVEQYAQGTDENSFCYWLEFKGILFGIGGGNASKFGLYKAKNGQFYKGSGKHKKALNLDTLENHFNKIKQGILVALDFTSKNEIAQIKTIDIPIWNMVLQKILSLYYPDKFITVGSPDVLTECARSIGLEGIDLSKENSIQINYECKKLLDNQPEFTNWEYEKIGAFIWGAYHKDSKIDYYVIGSKYGENNDNIFPLMLNESVVSTDFASDIDLTEYFQSNQNEITDFLKGKGESSNSYSALKLFLNIKKGDLVAIKGSGTPKRKQGFLSILGIAEVVEKDDKIYEFDSDGLGHTINVKYLKAPVYKEFSLGGFGTTIRKLSSTKQEQIDLIFKSDYEVVSIKEEMNESEKILIKALQKTGELDASHLYQLLSNLTNRLGLSEGDNRVLFNCKLRDKMVFTIGQRYCFSRNFVKPRKWSFILEGTIKTDKEVVREEFAGLPSAILAKTDMQEKVSNGFEQMVTASKLELERTTQSGFRKYNNAAFEKSVFDIDYRKEVFRKAFGEEIKQIMIDYPLNTIFYGPPGTGKTYNTILRAAEIVENRKITDYEEAKKIFDENLGDKIAFITFHQNYSYEDFIQGLRPDVDNGNTLTFERKDGIFKTIADRALKNLKESNQPESAKLDFNPTFQGFISPLVEGELEEIEVKMKKTSFYVTQVTSKSIEFRKNQGDSQHTLSINTLKNMYEKGENDIIVGGLQPYYNPILKKLLELGKSNNKLIKKQNYVLIIDEINRANISRVFGELITLIEPDKRSHGELPLKCTLPSGEEFIVPSNLYIIGTMNTADKSIALLDIALRRRFDFESMYPQYEIKGKKIYDVEILKNINNYIIKAKGHDFQIGHAYFMGENNDLKDRMNKKVIPLLLEYFMNDKNEVEKILKKAGLEVDPIAWPIKIKGRA